MEGVFEAISFVGIIFQSLHIRVPTIGFLLGLSLDMLSCSIYHFQDLGKTQDLGDTGQPHSPLTPHPSADSTLSASGVGVSSPC
jgi:hypothetical protein